MARVKPAVVLQPEVFARALFPCSCCQLKLLSSPQELPAWRQCQAAVAVELVDAPKPYESLTVRSYEPRKVCARVLYVKPPPTAGAGLTGVTETVWCKALVTPTPPWNCSSQRSPMVRPSVASEVVM